MSQSATPSATSPAGLAAPPSTSGATAQLLLLGALAGPIYCVLGAAQMFTREGFDPTRHPLSVLANGTYGWIQVANFLASGVLVIAGACGLWRALRAARGGKLGPALVAVYGLGLIGAGVFAADPMEGFPPGTPATSTISPRGGLHFLTGGIGFFGLIGACLVFALHFALARRWGWSAYSAATGVFFFAAFGAIASGSKQPAVILTFTGAVVAAWIWITALMLRTRRAT